MIYMAWAKLASFLEADINYYVTPMSQVVLMIEMLRVSEEALDATAHKEAKGSTRKTARKETNTI